MGDLALGARAVRALYRLWTRFDDRQKLTSLLSRQMVAMREIGAFEAKNKFGRLLDRVEAGEAVAITRRGKVVAHLAPPGGALNLEAASAAVARIGARRRGVTLGGAQIADLIAERRT
jgi:prevent-host-death family protein